MFHPSIRPPFFVPESAKGIGLHTGEQTNHIITNAKLENRSNRVKAGDITTSSDNDKDEQFKMLKLLK